jgi:heme-degrading monooxygenase HmoA
MRIATGTFDDLTPAAADYATWPLPEAFTWSGCAPRIEAGEWYLVAFRSILREGADEKVLEEYDLRAAEEAAQAPGFVHYYRGPVTSTRACLSFCIWESRDNARTASRGPRHIEAISLVEQMYESYKLEFHRLTKRADVAEFQFEPYDVLAVASEG